MKISYFPKQMALYSDEVWTAFLDSCKDNNITPIENSVETDFLLIWSVLWNGRMKPNYEIYNFFRKNNKPVFILEVGSLLRGKTWKVSLNNINKFGIYAHLTNHLDNRSKKLGIHLRNLHVYNNKPILIACQHEHSLQWTYNGTVMDWVSEKINQIRQFHSDEIYIRPHPRYNFLGNFGSKVYIQKPNKIINTYDEYDIEFDYKFVLNFNSGVGIKSVINGTPLICDSSSLAYEVSSSLNELNFTFSIDRVDWFNCITHTEWTIDEIKEGIPIKRLLKEIT